MQIIDNASLKKYNSFSLNIQAKKLIIIEDKADFFQIAELFPLEKKIILGEGTNVLFKKDFDGIVIINKISYFEQKNENKNFIIFDVGAGFIWDEFVKKTLEYNLWQAVNLSGIPGTVGAAPVQNIGAYGAEAKNIIDSVEFFSFENNKIIQFTNEQCIFAYRDSIFKSLAGKGAILSVRFKMNKNNQPDLSYKDLKNAFDKQKDISPLILRNKILEIRNSKLPNHKKIPNAGSFFKNPYIYKDFYFALKEKYPRIPAYRINNNVYKIPAAWLIDNAGLKGFSVGGAKVYENQPLVIINNNNATPDDILNLMRHVKNTVFEKFKIQLTPEVRII